MRHKHADEIIAWANGAKIQNKFGDDQWFDTLKPHWDIDREYRIKPEPKPDVVEYYSIGIGKHHVFCAIGDSWEKPNLKLTFDGETDKLKSAEVMR